MIMIWRCTFCKSRWDSAEGLDAHMVVCPQLHGNGFLCPNCQRTSYHPKDVEFRFCVTCGFADDPAAAA
jgi:hypothetical protein